MGRSCVTCPLKIIYIMKSSIFFILLLFCVSFSYCQEANKVKSELNFGISLSQPDVRPVFNIQPKDKPWFEYDIFLNFNKRVLERNRFKLFVGIGYLLNIDIVTRSFLLIHDGMILDINLKTQSYFKSNIHLPIEMRYNLTNKESNNFVFTLSAINNITAHKFIKFTTGGKFSNIKFEAAETELYTGVRYEMGNWGYYLQYRLINVQYKDDALDNDSKDVDYFNPIKFRIGINKMF